MTDRIIAVWNFILHRWLLMMEKLMELDKAICDDQRIPAIHTIEKIRPEYKNKKNRKS